MGWNERLFLNAGIVNFNDEKMSWLNMKSKNHYISSPASIAVAFLLLLISMPASSDPGNNVDETIQYLISYIASSELTFIRNNGKYTSTEAADHINKKYQHFRDKIKTPEDFISLCASKSMLSGNYYQVVDRQGKKIRTRDWLSTELMAYQTHSQ